MHLIDTSAAVSPRRRHRRRQFGGDRLAIGLKEELKALSSRRH